MYAFELRTCYFKDYFFFEWTCTRKAWEDPVRHSRHCHNAQSMQILKPSHLWLASFAWANLLKINRIWSLSNWHISLGRFCFSQFSPVFEGACAHSLLGTILRNACRWSLPNEEEHAKNLAFLPLHFSSGLTKFPLGKSCQELFRFGQNRSGMKIRKTYRMTNLKLTKFKIKIKWSQSGCVNHSCKTT